MRPEHDAAVEAVRGWKAKWSLSTFGLGDRAELDEAELEMLESGGEEKVRQVLREFGPTLVRLAEPVRGRWEEAEKLQVEVIENQDRDIDALRLMKDCGKARERVLDAEHPNTFSSLATMAEWRR